MSSNLRFGYNPTAARYVDLNTGRFVSQDSIIQVVEQRITAGQERVSDLLYGALEGSNDLGAWQEAMAQELKRAHLENYALGKGGWNQMTQADYGRVGRVLRDEYGYLRDFAEQINQGKLSLKQIEARARQYQNKIRNAYWNGQQQAHIAQGYTECRRVLNPAEHCDDCTALAGRGWQPIGSLPVPADGSTQCLSNCQCTMEYR